MRTRAKIFAAAVALVLISAGSAIVANAQEPGDCDDRCPFDGSGNFIACTPQNPWILCSHDDSHHYHSGGTPGCTVE